MFQTKPSQPKRFILNFEEDTLTIVHGDGTNTIKNTQAPKATTEKPKHRTANNNHTYDHGLDYGLDPLPDNDVQEQEAETHESNM